MGISRCCQFQHLQRHHCSGILGCVILWQAPANVMFMPCVDRPESTAGSGPTATVTSVISTGPVTSTQLDDPQTSQTGSVTGGSTPSHKSNSGAIAGGSSTKLHPTVKRRLTRVLRRRHRQSSLACRSHHRFPALPSKKKAESRNSP